MRLTATTIRSLTLPAGKVDHVYFDDELPGFGLRVRRSGDEDLVGSVRHGRTNPSWRSARSPNWTSARPAAPPRTCWRKFASAEILRTRSGRARPAGETVGALLPAFLERQRARLKPRSYVETERHLKRHCKPLHPWLSPRWTVAPSRRAWPRSPRRAARRRPTGSAAACRLSSRGARERVTSIAIRRPTPTRRSRTAREIAC